MSRRALLLALVCGALAVPAEVRSQSGTAPGADTLLTPADALAAAASGEVAGRELAKNQSTAGWFAGGVGSGFLLGLIGTGIIYVAAGNSGTSLPSGHETVLAPKGPLYSEAFQRSYREQLKSKRKTAALGGGLLGTATFVVLYLSTQSE